MPVTQPPAVAPDKTARVQTYAFIDFEASGAFIPSIHDTSIAAHKVGEWMDDPFGNNPTPAWGHTGQVGACQGNLEVGDPLTATNVPPVAGETDSHIIYKRWRSSRGFTEGLRLV